MQSKVTALCCEGKIVTGRSHLDAWEQLSEEEKNGQIESGFYDLETKEFVTDLCDEKETDRKESNEVHNNN